MMEKLKMTVEGEEILQVKGELFSLVESGKLGESESVIISSDWFESPLIDMLRWLMKDSYYETFVGFDTFDYMIDALNSVEYGEKEVKGTVAILLTMEVYKKQRGKGWGGAFLNQMCTRFKRLGVDYVILNPQPFGDKLSDEEKSAKIMELREFYSKHGFTLHERKDLKYNYMYLDLTKYQPAH